MRFTKLSTGEVNVAPTVKDMSLATGLPKSSIYNILRAGGSRVKDYAVELVPLTEYLKEARS